MGRSVDRVLARLILSLRLLELLLLLLLKLPPLRHQRVMAGLALTRNSLEGLVVVRLSTLSQRPITILEGNRCPAALAGDAAHASRRR